MYATLIGIALAALFTTQYLAPLLSNYQKARRTGFPVVISFVNTHNPLWMVIGGLLVIPLSRSLPASAWRRLRYSMRGWAFLDHARRVDAPAPAFVLVTSGKNELWVEDPEIAQQVMSRSQDFLPPEVTKSMMGIMGPNILTTDGHDWQRHRRIVTAALGERISNLVWYESVKQATALLEDCSNAPGAVTDKTMSGLRRLAINVLALSGYGVEGLSDTENAAPAPGHMLSYTDVLNALATGFVLIALLPESMLCSKWMPQSIQTFGTAAKEFPKYTRELLDQERQASASSRAHRRSFISSLVAISDNNDNDAKQKFSEPEIQGGLFIFTLGAFDTTANTMAYAVAMLALNDELQDWLVEEMDEIEASKTGPEYETVFPQLKRCLALMYETLRLYTPVDTVGRTVRTSQTISAASSSVPYVIPDDTNVFVSIARIHTGHEFWGKDAFEFRPSRWLSEKSPSSPEAFVDVPRGAFCPWSGGSRMCPGMKMSKVEFVATIYTLFKHFTVRPAVLEGETAAMARARTLGVILDSKSRLTLQMVRPNDIKLVWQRRE